MVEPISLAVLGGVALSEGIKFLYNQAGEILKRRRESKEAEPIPVESPDVIEGNLEPMTVDPAAVEELADELKALRAQLNEYAQETEQPDPSDEEVLRATDALREAIESIVGQRITFKGEHREPSGTPVVTGTVRAKQIRAKASGVAIEEMGEGEARGVVEADSIEQGADVAGARIGKMGRTCKPD
jgi:hypothetical protein